MRLDRRIERSVLLDPRSGFSRFSSEVEIRTDPLTGGVSRMNTSRAARPKQPMKIEIGGAHAGTCAFCPGSIEACTPKFPPGFVEGEGKGRDERFRSGGAITFPNMFPLSEFHGVCVFTPAHTLELGRFSRQEILDGLKCSALFIRAAGRMGAPFHFMGWNHLSPAGASVLHPHFQIMASREGFRGLNGCLIASERYARENGRSFWEELVEVEAQSPRYIGSTGSFSWYAPWAPLGGLEVLGVCTSSKGSLLMLDDTEMGDLSEGIVRVLRGLWGLGTASVNMGVFSMPEGRRADWFSLNVRITGRPTGVISDRAFLEVFGDEVGLTAPPEAYARQIRGCFQI